MSDCILVSVLGSGRMYARHNVKDARNPRESKAMTYPRERVGRVMRELKGEILSNEQRADRSKVWKQAIVGDKFIYHERYHNIRDD